MEENVTLEKSTKGGRPKAEIDWKKVDELLIAGCSGVEVASYFGLNPATIYDRCTIDKEMPFSEYSQLKQQKGESILRAHQYAKALGLTDKGDNTLLIWLGKTRLKQREEQQVQGNDAEIVELLKSLKEQKQNALKPETDQQL